MYSIFVDEIFELGSPTLQFTSNLVSPFYSRTYTDIFSRKLKHLPLCSVMSSSFVRSDTSTAFWSLSPSSLGAEEFPILSIPDYWKDSRRDIN